MPYSTREERINYLRNYRIRNKVIISKKRREKYLSNPLPVIFRNILKRCSSVSSSTKDAYYQNKGIKCLLTMPELIQLWDIYKADKMKRPSIDRIDPNGDYIMSNCRFIELSDNCKRSLKKKWVHGVNQLDDLGNFIRHWDCPKEAADNLGVTRNQLYICLSGKNKTKKGYSTCAGYRWEYSGKKTLIEYFNKERTPIIQGGTNEK